MYQRDGHISNEKQHLAYISELKPGPQGRSLFLDLTQLEILSWILLKIRIIITPKTDELTKSWFLQQDQQQSLYHQDFLTVIVLLQIPKSHEHS